MSHGTVRIQREGPVARVVLDRPAIHNAVNDAMIEDLLEVFSAIRSEDSVRVAVLAAEGFSFCAGADIHWMKQVLSCGYEENYQGSLLLAQLLREIYTCPKPVVGRIQGSAIGGGTGLVAACDIAIAAESAVFGFSEARLGLVPAVISPYLMKRMGERALREYFLTGERFSAGRAAELGLVNQAVPLTDLDRAVQAKIEMILACGPAALAAAKDLIRRVADQPLDANGPYTADLIARLRMSEEGQEGMGAFLEKRRPRWTGR